MTAATIGGRRGREGGSSEQEPVDPHSGCGGAREEEKAKEGLRGVKPRVRLMAAFQIEAATSI